MCALEVPELKTSIKITDYDKTDIGQDVCVTIPLKKCVLRLSPTKHKKDLNVLTGVSKNLSILAFNQSFMYDLILAHFKIYKQHSNYLEDGPEIQWKDRVYVSFSPSDGYVVEEIDK